MRAKASLSSTPVAGPLSIGSFTRQPAVLTILTDLIAMFDDDWSSASHPPNLAAYLPDTNVLRRVTLLALIRVDLAHRWLGTGPPKRLAEYCDEFPELRATPLPVELICEEFRLRQQARSIPDPVEYLPEFADLAIELTTTLAAPDESNAADEQVEGGCLAVHDPRAELDSIGVGERIDDFDLLTELGSGAFSRVFLARQRSMQRLVAVKISPDHGTEPQTLALLDHDYIVRVFDQRLLPERRLKLLYMQYLPGGTLLDVLKFVRAAPVEQRSGQLLLDAVDAAMEEKGEFRPSDASLRAEIARLSWPETVAWLGRRLAEALDYADKRGVLHRDVKPANVLLTSEGVPKLVDFNVSFSRTVVGHNPFGGTLPYMSPEQLESWQSDRRGTAADLDTRSDIYSLGVMLWELLTGRGLYHDDVSDGEPTGRDAMLDRRGSGIAPGALADIPPDCPAALRRVLLTCLAPAPADRWSSGIELGQQFDLCLDAYARDLVDPRPDSWRMRLRPWRVPIISVAALVPNVLASIYNFRQSRALILSKLPVETREQLDMVTAANNLTLFPLAAVIAVYLCRHVLSVPPGLPKGRSHDPQKLARARSAALLIGDRVVLVAFGLWLVSTLAFEVAIQLVVANLPAGYHVNFLVSLAVSSAIGVAYPYFMVNFYAVRFVYPSFLRHGESGPDDLRGLRGLARRSNVYLAVAASVPLVAVASTTFIPSADTPVVMAAVRVLCVGAILAFIGVYWLFRMLATDLGALERVVAAHSKHRVARAPSGGMAQRSRSWTAGLPRIRRDV